MSFNGETLGETIPRLSWIPEIAVGAWKVENPITGRCSLIWICLFMGI